MKTYFSLRLMRRISIVAVLLGVSGSLSLVLYKGRNNGSVILVALFVAWVTSPYIVLLIVDKVSKRWTDFAHKTLYSLMIVLSIVSLLCYSGVLSPAGTKTAFVFLVVPLISWALIVILLLVGRSRFK